MSENLLSTQFYNSNTENRNTQNFQKLRYGSQKSINGQKSHHRTNSNFRKSPLNGNFNSNNPNGNKPNPLGMSKRPVNKNESRSKSPLDRRFGEAENGPRGGMNGSSGNFFGKDSGLKMEYETNFYEKHGSVPKRDSRSGKSKKRRKKKKDNRMKSRNKELQKRISNLGNYNSLAGRRHSHQPSNKTSKRSANSKKGKKKMTKMASKRDVYQGERGKPHDVSQYIQSNIQGNIQMGMPHGPQEDILARKFKRKPFKPKHPFLKKYFNDDGTVNFNELSKVNVSNISGTPNKSAYGDDRSRSPSVMHRKKSINEGNGGFEPVALDLMDKSPMRNGSRSRSPVGIRPHESPFRGNKGGNPNPRTKTLKTFERRIPINRGSLSGSSYSPIPDSRSASRSLSRSPMSQVVYKKAGILRTAVVVSQVAQPMNVNVIPRRVVNTSICSVNEIKQDIRRSNLVNKAPIGQAYPQQAQPAQGNQVNQQQNNGLVAQDQGGDPQNQEDLVKTQSNFNPRLSHKTQPINSTIEKRAVKLGDERQQKISMKSSPSKFEKIESSKRKIQSLLQLNNSQENSPIKTQTSDGRSYPEGQPPPQANPLQSQFNNQNPIKLQFCNPNPNPNLNPLQAQFRLQNQPQLSSQNPMHLTFKYPNQPNNHQHQQPQQVQQQQPPQQQLQQQQQPPGYNPLMTALPKIKNLPSHLTTIHEDKQNENTCSSRKYVEQQQKQQQQQRNKRKERQSKVVKLKDSPKERYQSSATYTQSESQSSSSSSESDSESDTADDQTSPEKPNLLMRTAKMMTSQEYFAMARSNISMAHTINTHKDQQNVHHLTTSNVQATTLGKNSQENSIDNFRLTKNTWGKIESKHNSLQQSKISSISRGDLRGLNFQKNIVKENTNSPKYSSKYVTSASGLSPSQTGQTSTITPTLNSNSKYSSPYGCTSGLITASGDKQYKGSSHPNSLIHGKPNEFNPHHKSHQNTGDSNFKLQSAEGKNDPHNSLVAMRFVDSRRQQENGMMKKPDFNVDIQNGDKDQPNVFKLNESASFYNDQLDKKDNYIRELRIQNQKLMEENQLVGRELQDLRLGHQALVQEMEEQEQKTSDRIEQHFTRRITDLEKLILGLKNEVDHLRKKKLKEKKKRRKQKAEYALELKTRDDIITNNQKEISSLKYTINLLTIELQNCQITDGSSISTDKVHDQLLDELEENKHRLKNLEKKNKKLKKELKVVRRGSVSKDDYVRSESAFEELQKKVVALVKENSRLNTIINTNGNL